MTNNKGLEEYYLLHPPDQALFPKEEKTKQVEDGLLYKVWELYSDVLYSPVWLIEANCGLKWRFTQVRPGYAYNDYTLQALSLCCHVACFESHEKSGSERFDVVCSACGELTLYYDVSLYLNQLRIAVLSQFSQKSSYLNRLDREFFALSLQNTVVNLLTVSKLKKGTPWLKLS